jgi:hypothetical protein
MTTTNTHVRQLQQRREKAFEAAHAIAERASRENRHLTDHEQRQYDSYTANLDHATRDQQALLAGNGRDPHQALAELKGKRRDSTPGNHLHQRLEIQKRLGDRTAAAITLHNANERDRRLNSAAATIEQDQRTAEWSATLAHQARRGELTQSLIDFHDHDNSQRT